VNKLKEEVKSELTDHILPFWMELEDKENGGVYGTINYELEVNKEANKGGIITSRFLWTYSAAARVLKNNDYLKFANRLYRFLENNLIDKEHQGIYWMVDYKGNPVDTRKHVYAQSFAIYALCEYFRASGNENALQLAKDLFHLVETKGFDSEANAYKEEFDREWNEIPNEMLSENGVMADITMNTTIHVLEAYTTLFKAWPSDEVRRSLENLLHMLYEKIYDKETKYLGVFFDKKWNSLLDLKSFGHDIEASWLIDEALKALGNERPEYIQMVKDIAYNIASYAIQEDGSLINEEENGHKDLTRVWWVQVEAMVGFHNAYQRTEDKKFLGLLENLWTYTKNNIIDSRDNGEWYWSIEPDGKPSNKNIGDPWKGSYHNGRFCLEIIERMK
jgi:cellobiose epimerase